MIQRRRKNGLRFALTCSVIGHARLCGQLSPSTAGNPAGRAAHLGLLKVNLGLPGPRTGCEYTDSGESRSKEVLVQCNYHIGLDMQL